MKLVVFGKLYDTATSSVVANDLDDNWDGNDFVFLYRTPEGLFFVYGLQGGEYKIQPITLSEARVLYEELPVHLMSLEEAFGEEED